MIDDTEERAKIAHRKRLGCEKNARYREKIRQETWAAYGNICSECGSTDQGIFEIDHIDGNGNEERAEFSPNTKRIEAPGGWNFYIKLRRLGFPKGYQILCVKCSTKKHGGERGNPFGRKGRR